MQSLYETAKNIIATYSNKEGCEEMVANAKRILMANLPTAKIIKSKASLIKFIESIGYTVDDYYWNGVCIKVYLTNDVVIENDTREDVLISFLAEI